jgi:hypothetical protein
MNIVKDEAGALPRFRIVCAIAMKLPGVVVDDYGREKFVGRI